MIAEPLIITMAERLAEIMDEKGQPDAPEVVVQKV